MKRYRNLFFNADTGAPSGGDPGVSTPPSSATPPAGATLLAPDAPPSESSAPSFIGADGAFVEGWHEKLPDEFGDSRKGYAKFKTFGDLIKSHTHLESRLGKAATAVFVPGQDATPDEVSAYRKAIGVPEDINGYKVKPDQIPDGANWDDEAVKPYLEIAYKHNIPEAAMKDFVALDLQRELGRSGSVEAAAKVQLEEGNKVLTSLWGEKLPEKIESVRSVASLVGVDPRSPGFTDPNIVKAFARVAEMIGDDKMHNGGPSGPMSQDKAAWAKDVMTNPANPMYARYQAGEKDVVDRVLTALKQ